MRAAKIKGTITFSFTVRTREPAPIPCSMYIFSNETEICTQNCGLRPAATAQASTYIRHVLVAIVQHPKGQPHAIQRTFRGVWTAPISGAIG